MKIAIGADHRGFAQKEFIKKNLTLAQKKIEWIDIGADSEDRSDYPDFAMAVAKKMQAGQADIGILLCGTGVGMSIAANRFKGVYAGLAWNETIAELNKKHDNVNLLVLPADFVTNQQAVAMVSAWLIAKFAGGRYQERIEKVDSID